MQMLLLSLLASSSSSSAPFCCLLRAEVGASESELFTALAYFKERGSAKHSHRVGHVSKACISYNTIFESVFKTLVHSLCIRRICFVWNWI